MYDITKTRMLLTTAAFAAVAALFAGGANAMFLDDGGSASGAQPFPSGHQLDTAIGTAMATQAAATAPAFPSGHQLDTAIGTALKVDRAVAAANEAYDTWRDKTAIAAREALFTDQQPSVGLSGDSALTRSSAPQTLWRSSAPQALTRSSAPQPAVTLPTASSASDGVDWAWFGLGAGMTALLAAGIAGVVLTTRRRGDIALP